MNLNELKTKLEAEKVFENLYSIGKPMEERLCIMRKDDKWIIFGCERGKNFIIKEYDNENDACESFLVNLKDAIKCM